MALGRKRTEAGCYTTHHSPGDGTGLDAASFRARRPQDILDGEPPGDGDYRGYAPPTNEDTGRTTFADRPRRR